MDNRLLRTTEFWMFTLPKLAMFAGFLELMMRDKAGFSATEVWSTRLAALSGIIPSPGSGDSKVDTNLRQVGFRAGGLEIGDLVFQSFYFLAAGVRTVERAFRVGFKSAQKLPQSDKVRVGRGFQHAPDRNRLARREKWLSTYN
jgi:hypothetical protein